MFDYAVIECFRTSTCHFEEAITTEKSSFSLVCEISQGSSSGRLTFVRNDRALIHSSTAIINTPTLWRLLMGKSADVKKETKKKPTKTPKEKKQEKIEKKNKKD